VLDGRHEGVAAHEPWRSAIAEARLLRGLAVLLVPVQRELEHDLVIAPEHRACFAVDLPVCEEEGDGEGGPREDLAVAGEVFSWGAIDGGVEGHAGTEEHAVDFASCFGWEAEEGEGEVFGEWYRCGDFGFGLCGKQWRSGWSCFRCVSHCDLDLSLELSNWRCVKKKTFIQREMSWENISGRCLGRSPQHLWRC